MCSCPHAISAEVRWFESIKFQTGSLCDIQFHCSNKPPLPTWRRYWFPLTGIAIGLFSVWWWYLYAHWALYPCSSQQSFVVPVSATDALNPTEWAQNSCVFQTDWNLDGTSPRLKEAAQKVLAETVRFHVEDFGEAGSLFQSLKQGDKKGCQKHIFSKRWFFWFLTTYFFKNI